MKPYLTVEFSVKSGEMEFKEENVSFHTTDEFFEFISPAGGCESIPDEVAEIQMVLLRPEHANKQNPLADSPATLELGILYLTGPLAEIAQVVEGILDKAGRGEISQAFLKVSGVMPEVA